MTTSIKKRQKLKGKTEFHREFLSADQLQKLADNDYVLVDSSAVCAIVQECIFSGGRISGRIVRKLESRMFARQNRMHDSIIFGEYIEMSIREVSDVFGNPQEVPVGVIKAGKSKKAR